MGSDYLNLALYYDELVCLVMPFILAFFPERIMNQAIAEVHQAWLPATGCVLKVFGVLVLHIVPTAIPGHLNLHC